MDKKYRKRVESQEFQAEDATKSLLGLSLLGVFLILGGLRRIQEGQNKVEKNRAKKENYFMI